jgi:CheY-like chemotaxis protein
LLEVSADYDCILCDLMMPGLTGAAFYAALSARWPALAGRVAIMTGGAITPDSKQFLDGFKGEVLRKPFSLEAAQQCIARLAARAEPSLVPAPPAIGRTS